MAADDNDIDRRQLQERARRRMSERHGDPHEDPPGGGGTSFARWAWEWTKSIAVAVLVFLVVRTFLVEAFQIPTGSMENTLQVGDYLLVNKVVYGAEIPGTGVSIPGYSEPEFGQIVVFEPPRGSGQADGTNYVKRVVGLPGDTLAMRDGVLYRNGERVEEPYARRANSGTDGYSPSFSWQRRYLVKGLVDPGRYRPTRDSWGPIHVPEDSYFVLGDNRGNSEDSRYWGFVPAEKVKGDPMFIYFSYDRERLSPFPWLTEIRWDRLFMGI